MLSYKHAFHAGNFADVLKHVTLVYTLEYLVLKPGPICYIDTHAGCGTYDLSSSEAQKNREFESGISRLWDQTDLPKPLARYVRMVREFNGGESLNRYPGSPWFARRILRSFDQLFLYEMHTREFDLLRNNYGADRRINILRDDGFSGCKALLPPRQRRGLILIDPSYEIKTDYREVIAAMKEAWHRFRTGVCLIWYPVVDRKRIEKMEKLFRTSGMKNILLLELAVTEDSTVGMTGCGMFVINPPWTLLQDMAAVLPFLVKLLGSHSMGRYRIEILAGE